MKRFITAMLFSLTVIVCEQQTLFAPHYKDYSSGLTAANPSDTTHCLVPVAGVNMSIPLSGTSNFCGSPKCAPSRFKLLGANSGLHSMSSPLFRMSSTTAVDDSNSCGVMDSFKKYAHHHSDDGGFDSTSQSSQAILPNIVDPNDCPRVMDDMRYESAQSSNDPVFFSHHGSRVDNETGTNW